MRKHTQTLARILFITMSFIQSHWVPIACAAGTVAAATMFGDKGYMMEINKQAKELISEQKPKEAIKILESTIAEYLIWHENNLGHTGAYDRYLNDLYYQLAVAKEKAGHPENEILEAYKDAISSRNSEKVFDWLYSRISEEEYKDLIVKHCWPDNGTMHYFNVGTFAKTENWPAFRLFMDVLFSRTDDIAGEAKRIEIALAKNKPWSDEFQKYCRNKPQFIEYALEKDFQQAQEYIENENFARAVQIYREILKSAPAEMDTAKTELKIYECRFNAGDYQGVIPELEEFISSKRASHRPLVKKAILMKGRAFVQLGEVDKAIGEFLTLTIEYPETKNAPEANFFIGYCYMLQSKFDLAKEALNLVIADYPKSSFASKARLCLTRIKTMTE